MKRHFESPAQEVEDAEARGEVRPLYLRRWIRRLEGKPAENPTPPPTWASILQTLVALVGIIGRPASS